MEIIKWILIALSTFLGSVLISFVYYLIAKNPKFTHSTASIVRAVLFVIYYIAMFPLSIHLDLSSSALMLGAYSGFILSRMYFVRKLVEVDPKDKEFLAPPEDKNKQ